MGALTDYAAYKAKVETSIPVARVVHIVAGLAPTSVAWSRATFTVTPTASVATGNTTALGAGSNFGTGLPGTLTNQLWLGKAEIAGPLVTAVGGMLVDVLNISGGMSAIIATAQTTNIPTAALTRYTTGDGVCLALVIWTAIGATATTVTASYTNQAGTAGRTTKARVFGSSAAAGQVLIMSLQDGDTGVRSVESVTVAATTGTAGNFGVMLFKPLSALPMHQPTHNGVIGYAEGLQAGRMVEVLPNACLTTLMKYGSGASVASLNLIEA